MEFPPRVTLVEVKERLQSGLPLLFVDARRASDWKDAALMLPRALRIDPDDEQPRIELARYAGAMVVVYCAQPDEHDSARVAEMLIRNGIQDVYVLSGGVERWVDSDSPMQRKDEMPHATRVAPRVDRHGDDGLRADAPYYEGKARGVE